MPVLVQCPQCKQRLRLPDLALGKKVKCPKCEERFIAAAEVPSLSSDRPIKAANAQSQAKAAPRPETPIVKKNAAAPAGDKWDTEEEADHPESDDILPLVVGVNIIADSEKELKGRWVGKLTREGLALTKGKQKGLKLPVGVSARYLKNTSLVVDQDGRELTLVITKLGSYSQRLAQHMVDFLNGEREALVARDYSLPKYLFIPAVLPLGIPVITMGGAIGGALGVGLAGANLTIVQQEKWPVSLRLAVSLGLTAVGYAALVAIFMALGNGPAWLSQGGQQKPGDNAAPAAAAQNGPEATSPANVPPGWTKVEPPGGRFSVLMPGTPGFSNQEHAYKVNMSNFGPQFTVYYLDENVRPDPGSFFRIGSGWPKDYPGANLANDRPLDLHGVAGHEYRIVSGDNVSIRRLYVDGNRVYDVTVQGFKLDPASPDVQRFFDSFTILK